MAMDFQKYLDDAFSKINIADFLEPEPEVPPRDIYREIPYSSVPVIYS